MSTLPGIALADWRAQALEAPAVDLPVEDAGRYARLVERFGKQIGTPVLWLGGWSLGGTSISASGMKQALMAPPKK